MVVALLLTGCSDRPPKEYVHDVLLPMTPVKNQGASELCWAYAMLATIETEHILRGDSVNLSPVYVGRKLEDYKTINYPLELARFPQKELSTLNSNHRAMCQTALNLMARYGVVGYDVLPDDATKELSSPKWVFMLGAKYTPLEFAHSVCAPDEYLSLTCCPDSPYYKKIEVPVPDNWEHNRLLNIPLDTLKAHTDRALQHRHPVCWESRGHAMAIVGMAHDKAGRPYYVMKNSWGTDQPHGGLVYMPADEMWRDVIALYMTKEAYSLE